VSANRYNLFAWVRKAVQYCLKDLPLSQQVIDKLADGVIEQANPPRSSSSVSFFGQTLLIYPFINVALAYCVKNNKDAGPLVSILADIPQNYSVDLLRTLSWKVRNKFDKQISDEFSALEHEFHQIIGIRSDQWSQISIYLIEYWIYAYVAASILGGYNNDSGEWRLWMNGLKDQIVNTHTVGFNYGVAQDIIESKNVSYQTLLAEIINQERLMARILRRIRKNVILNRLQEFDLDHVRSSAIKLDFCSSRYKELGLDQSDSWVVQKVFYDNLFFNDWYTFEEALEETMSYSSMWTHWSEKSDYANQTGINKLHII
jgi:hypothetical protein